jgi:hypothetical protein
MKSSKAVEKLCARFKPDGRRCRTRALRGSKFCFFRDPSKENERAAARHAGGVSRSRPAAVLTSDVSVHHIGNIDDVKTLLSDTIVYTLTGTIDPKIANAVGQLSSIF